MILTVGEFKRNGKELLNTVDYFETYWPAFNCSCAFSKTKSLKLLVKAYR